MHISLYVPVSHACLYDISNTLRRASNFNYTSSGQLSRSDGRDQLVCDRTGHAPDGLLARGISQSESSESTPTGLARPATGSSGNESVKRMAPPAKEQQRSNNANAACSCCPYALLLLHHHPLAMHILLYHTHNPDRQRQKQQHTPR